MKYHVIRLTQIAHGQRQRWGVVEMIDRHFDGRMIFKLVPGEDRFSTEILAYYRAVELEKMVTFLIPDAPVAK